MKRQKAWSWMVSKAGALANPGVARLALVGTGAGIAALGMADPAMAGSGTGGTDFQEVWNTIVNWSQGALGRTIALSFIVVGLIRGIAAQSIMAFAIGVGAGLGLYNAETIVDTLFGGSVPMPPATEIEYEMPSTLAPYADLEAWELPRGERL